MYLKSCPICSSEPTLSEAFADRSGYYCECIQCGKSTDEFATKQAAGDAWNRSRPSDLKDTERRGMYAIIMKPFKTWWQTFYRLFSLIFGPAFSVSVIISLHQDPPVILVFGMSVFGLVWTVFGSYFFVRYSKKLFRAVRRLFLKDRIPNIVGVVFSYLIAICAHAALIWYVVIPFINKF